MSEFNLLDPGTRESLIKELNTYVIMLPMNPDKEGIGKLFEVLGSLVAVRDRISYIIRVGLEEYGKLVVEKIKVEQEYNNEKNKAILRDEVKILKSAELRNAAVDTLLQGYINKMNDINIKLEVVKNFIDQAKLVYNDIQDKLKTAKAQIDIGFLLFGDIRNDYKVRL